VCQGRSVLGEVHNGICRRKAYNYDKGMDKEILDKGILFTGSNTIFPMTWLGSQVAKKLRLSMRA